MLFDVAPGLPYQMGINNLLITHAHMDHASGLPYLIAQKAMLSQAPPNVYMPSIYLKPFQQIMKLWSEMENHSYEYNLIGVTEGTAYNLRPPYFFKIFTTYHRVPSTGYTVFERKKKLREEFHGLPADELIRLRKEGRELELHTEEPVVSFTGDTKIEFLDAAPWIKNSKVLVMEVTFVDQNKSVANARHWGHIHLGRTFAFLVLKN